MGDGNLLFEWRKVLFVEITTPCLYVALFYLSIGLFPFVPEASLSIANQYDHRSKMKVCTYRWKGCLQSIFIDPPTSPTRRTLGEHSFFVSWCPFRRERFLRRNQWGIFVWTCPNAPSPDLFWVSGSTPLAWLVPSWFQSCCSVIVCVSVRWLLLRRFWNAKCVNKGDVLVLV